VDGTADDGVEAEASDGRDSSVIGAA